MFDTALLTRVLPYALAQFFIVAFQWAAMIFLPVFFGERGFSEFEIGMLISVFSLVTLLLVFPLGALSDRLPPRPLLMGGALLSSLAASLMPAVEGFFGFASLIALAGAGFTLSSISLYSLFFKQVGAERRGLEVSIFNIGGILGAGFGAWWCGVLAERFSLSILFPMAALFALAWAMIALWLPRLKGISFPILEYGQDLKHARTWVLIFIIFTTASHAGFEQAGYALLQTEVIGLSTATVGRLFMIISLWMVMVTIWTGRLHDRGERPLLMMGAALIVSGVFMGASGSAKGAMDFLIYRILHTAGDSVINLLVLVVASIIFPRHRAGGAFAFILTINTASYFMFANLAGAVGGRFGIDRAFYLSGLIMAVGGIFLLLFRGRLRRLFRIGEPRPKERPAEPPPSVTA